MNQFSGSVSLPNNTPMTIGELVQAAIAARTYPTAQAETDAINRANPLIVGEGFVRPKVTDVWMIDAYKGVRNGVVIAADWAAGDFTMVPGGAQQLIAEESTHFNNGVDLATRVLFQDSGAAVVLHIDVIIN